MHREPREWCREARLLASDPEVTDESETESAPDSAALNSDNQRQGLREQPDDRVVRVIARCRREEVAFVAREVGTGTEVLSGTAQQD